MFSPVASYADVNRVIPLFVVFFALAPFIAAIVFRLFLVAADLVEFFGFGGRIDGVLHQRRHSLSVRDSFSRDVLREGVRYYRGWYGWNLHPLYPLQRIVQADYCTDAINKHLIISCKRL